MSIILYLVHIIRNCLHFLFWKKWIEFWVVFVSFEIQLKYKKWIWKEKLVALTSSHLGQSHKLHEWEWCKQGFFFFFLFLSKWWILIQNNNHHKLAQKNLSQKKEIQWQNKPVFFQVNFVMWQSSHHPQEDLAKFGCKKNFLYIFGYYWNLL